MQALSRTIESQPLILFDGVCNLCQRSVQFVIRNDSNGSFRFASLQSNVAASLLEQYSYEDDRLDSMILIVGDRLYRKSRAALQIARRLDKAWPLFFYLFFWVPSFIGDPIYSFIGNRRYRWFGKMDECWIPDPDIAARFIDQDRAGP